MIDRLEISEHGPRLRNCRQSFLELRPDDLSGILKIKLSHSPLPVCVSQLTVASRSIAPKRKPKNGIRELHQLSTFENNQSYSKRESLWAIRGFFENSSFEYFMTLELTGL